VIVSHRRSCTGTVSQSQSNLTTDDQSASLTWYHATIWDPRPIFLALPRNYLQTFPIFYYWSPSLNRGRFCNLQLLLGLGCAVFLGSEARGPHVHILQPQFSDSPNMGGRWAVVSDTAVVGEARGGVKKNLSSVLKVLRPARRSGRGRLFYQN
jgi:hypothetical protein